MESMVFMFRWRMASVKQTHQIQLGPRGFGFQGLTWLAHIEKPSWCSATGTGESRAGVSEQLRPFVGIAVAALGP